MQTITATLLAAPTRGERIGVAMPRAPELATRPLELPTLTEADHACAFDRGRNNMAPLELPRARVCAEAGHPRARGLTGPSHAMQASAPMAMGIRVKHVFRRAEAVQ